MSIDQGDIDFVVDLFADLGGISTRKMFGGLALYAEGIIFAVLRSDGQILLKGQGDFIPRIEALGGQHWTFTRKNGKAGAMPYWSLPDAYLEDPEAATALAREALNHL